MVTLAALALSLAGAALVPTSAISQDANGNSSRNVNKSPVDGRTTPKPRCEAAEIVVFCGMPGCNVLLNGAYKGVTDETGQLRFPVPANSTHTVLAYKSGHTTASDKVLLKCGGTKSLSLTIKPLTVTLKVRTNLPHCDIYLNTSANPVGKTDAGGVLEQQVVPSTVLVEARKKGYLSAIKTAYPVAGTGGEVTLVLTPLPASLNISTNVDRASVKVDTSTAVRITRNDRISVTPERHLITVEALGHVPKVFEINPAPDEAVNTSAVLERYPVAELIKQARQLYEQRVFADVITLCKYIFESDRNNATAHALTGVVRLVEHDYANAALHLTQALAGNETIMLAVRRHLRESFDFNRGHDNCKGILILSGTEVEFRAEQNPAENFKVPYNQIEVLAPRLKKETAVYLPTRVTISRGKKRDYNFFANEKELTAGNLPYLELLKLLLSRR